MAKLENREKTCYEESPCFNCRHDMWKEIYDEEGWGGTWDHYCSMTGESFKEDEFPKECQFFEPRGGRFQWLRD